MSFLALRKLPQSLGRLSCFRHSVNIRATAQSFQRDNRVVSFACRQCGLVSSFLERAIREKANPNEVTSADGAWRVLFAFIAQWPAATEFWRQAT
jgi:hypothetical protein